MEKSILHKQHTTHSSKETQLVAQELAKHVLGNPRKQKDALVIALRGELGSGKTTFAQGFAHGLGIEEKILSPTFLIVRSYAIPSCREMLYHIDCYRIENENELFALGWDKVVSDPKNIVLLEWPERVQNLLPRDRKEIIFTSNGANERTVIIN